MIVSHWQGVEATPLKLPTPTIRTTLEWSPCNATRKFQPYYIRREPAGNYENYWGVITDPDGVVRDRTQEREQYLADIAEDMEFFRSHSFDAVCDVGAGLGWFIDAIDARQKLAVEVAPQALETLSTKGWRVRTDVADVWTSTQDAVFCHHVIEHVADPVGMIHHLRRIIRPRGWLVIATPDFASPCAKRFGENYRLLKDPTHVSLFTNESMHRFLRDHGFTIHDVKYPFPARYATVETMERWNDTSKVSPPWPGNFMTFYATKGG